MSTKKLFANRVPKRYGTFIAEDGSRYAYINSSQGIKTGDNFYLAKKLPVPDHSMYPWKYEIYPIVIETERYTISGKYYYWPKTWFGNGKYIVEKIN